MCHATAHLRDGTRTHVAGRGHAGAGREAFLPRLLSLLQSLRSFSHPLQRWQWDLLVLEDELPLQFSPRNPLIQPFTLHHKVGRETQRDVMLLGTRRRLDRRGSAPLV